MFTMQGMDVIESNTLYKCRTLIDFTLIGGHSSQLNIGI